MSFIYNILILNEHLLFLSSWIFPFLYPWPFFSASSHPCVSFLIDVWTKGIFILTHMKIYTYVCVGNWYLKWAFCLIYSLFIWPNWPFENDILKASLFCDWIIIYRDSINSGLIRLEYLYYGVNTVEFVHYMGFPNTNLWGLSLFH